MIQTILEKMPGKIVLDHLMLDDKHGQPYVTDDADTVKGEVLHYFCDVWHAPHICEKLKDHPFWANAYKEHSNYGDDVWEGLMAVPSTGEVYAAVSSAPLRKAPGVSGIPGDVLKRLGPTATLIFVTLIQACIAKAKIPLAWTQGLIYCIPKGRVWSGRISEVRPITLLEHLRKSSSPS
jgi:hypothetical protein